MIEQHQCAPLTQAVAQAIPPPQQGVDLLQEQLFPAACQATFPPQQGAGVLLGQLFTEHSQPGEVSSGQFVRGAMPYGGHGWAD